MKWVLQWRILVLKFLNNLVKRGEMHEMESIGPFYTWSNKQEGDDMIFFIKLIECLLMRGRIGCLIKL